MLLVGYLAWAPFHPQVVFYGKLIDQHQQPVANAKIYTSVARASFVNTVGNTFRTTTDSEGYFFIKAKSSNLLLGAITHPEIDDVYYDRVSPFNSEVEDRKRVIFFQRKIGSKYKPGYGGHETKETAYVVRAWRLTQPHQGAYAGEVYFSANADDSEYTLTLNPFRRRNYIRIGRHPGQFRISCSRPHMESARDYGNWHFSLKPIAGGVQKTGDLYVNFAPADGYQPSLEIEMIEGSEDFKTILRNQRYYFVVNNGESYGSLSIDLKPFSHDDKESCFFRFGFTINPTGSRNLELTQKNL